MVVAPFSQTEGVVEPYVSLDEVKFSPTAAVVDFTNLIPNSSQAVQDRALYELIVRASSKADNFCYGKLGTLNATSNTEQGWYRPNRSGNIVIGPSFTPILAVTDFQTGWGPGSGLQEITLSSSNCFIDRDQFWITAPSTLGLYFGSLGIAGGRWGYQTEMLCQWTYVNGWANTFTTSTSAVGATSITVSDPTGIYPGMHITIWDGQMDEYVQVSSSYATGSSTITLTNPLAFKHGSGVSVSSIPASVKQAVIHLIVGLIKERGQGALILSDMGEPASSSGRATHLDEEAQAYDLLEPFKVTWGRS